MAPDLLYIFALCPPSCKTEARSGRLLRVGVRNARLSRADIGCTLACAGGDIVATLIELLTDLNGEVATAAACALGEIGRVEARDPLKRYLIEKPSPRVIECPSSEILRQEAA
jgi:HEAT repeat protein